LGHKFSILEKKKKRKKSKDFNVIMYNGSGGDLIFFEKIIKFFFLKKEKLHKKNVIFKVVIGPFSKNKEKILNFSKKNKQIIPILNCYNLNDILFDANLFVGSAGVSSFETAFNKVPSILFQVNSNQIVQSKYMEKIGHFIILKLKDLYAYEKIIKKSLSDLKLKLRILQPEAYFSPSGGAILSGKFSILNKYVAVPSYSRIIEFLKNESYIIFEIAGGGKIIRKKRKWVLIKSKVSNGQSHKKKIVKKYSNKKYFYSNDFKRIGENDIDQAFLKSYENYKKRLTNFQIKTNWDAEFYIYQNLSINSKGKINLKNSKFLKKYMLNYNKPNCKLLKNNYSKLKCHLDFNLFYGLLKRKYTNWNQPMSGSVILYERKPNIFDPNLVFSLNYLSI
jgi:hypothetical protein